MPARDVLDFTQQLATLVEAGLPLERALVVLGEVAASRRLRQIVQDVTQSVRAGSTLADALARHQPRPFSRLYVNTVRAGERGGVLEIALRRLAEHLERRRELREAVVSALIYPALLIVVGTAAVDLPADLRAAALRGHPGGPRSDAPPAHAARDGGERGVRHVLVGDRGAR